MTLHRHVPCRGCPSVSHTTTRFLAKATGQVTGRHILCRGRLRPEHKPIRILEMAHQAGHTPKRHLHLKTHYRSHAATPISDGARVQITRRHFPCRRSSNTGNMPTRQLQLAPQSGNRRHLLHRWRLRHATCRNVHCKCHRSPSHTTASLMWMAPQFRQLIDTKLAVGAAVHTPFRHVICIWQHVPGHTPSRPFPMATKSKPHDGT
jgi:hypothetical protein